MKSKKQKNDGQLPLPNVQAALEVNQGGRPKGMPSLTVIRDEITKMGFPSSDGDAVFDSWLASGFRLKNGNKVRDWKACLRNWARNDWFPSQKKRGSAYRDEARAERRVNQFRRMKDGSSD